MIDTSAFQADEHKRQGESEDEGDGHGLDGNVALEFVHVEDGADESGDEKEHREQG
jgi:hypothetical protein